MPESENYSTPCTVRKASAEDLDVLGYFSSCTARETEGRELDPARIAKSLKRVIDDPSLGQMFIAEFEGRPVGSYQVNGREWTEWRDGIFYWITGLYVVPEFRRRGVMFDLYRAAVEWVREQPDGLGLRAYIHRDNNLEMLLGEGTAERNNQEELQLKAFDMTPYVVIEVLV